MKSAAIHNQMSSMTTHPVKTTMSNHLTKSFTPFAENVSRAIHWHRPQDHDAQYDTTAQNDRNAGMSSSGLPALQVCPLFLPGELVHL